MNISTGTMHNLVSRLDVPRINKHSRKSVASIPVEVSNEELSSVSDSAEETVESIVELDNEVPVEIENAEPQEIESEKIDEKKEDNIIEETRQDDNNNNSLTVEIKGNYSTNAIIKSIQSILQTLEGEEEIVNIDLKVRKR